jgi:hypothetical protein
VRENADFRFWISDFRLKVPNLARADVEYIVFNLKSEIQNLKSAIDPNPASQ